jgi:serine/threonine protein kinase/class 3 adenylate cyclase
MAKNPLLPTGTVTFLFTDIQGSTSLYENYPVQMQAALERHDEILRSSIENHEGYVFKTVGDAFCAAFATARAALQATLTSQRALFAETWPENIQQLRVRIALHTGVADERDGDYFGPPVNRVARLLSAGHGGQILLSDAAYNLARDHLVHLEPEGKLRDLGEHRLKDLRYTEHIYQLIVPDLPKDFPPLRSYGVVKSPELSNLDRRYRQIRHIGSGGMGEVYLVHHEALDRDMALKILKNEYANDEQFLERFRREAKSMAKLSHPNLVQVYDAGEGFFEGSRVSYMAMEYVPGGTLKGLIHQQKSPLPSGVATNLTLQIGKALEAAHNQGVIHRDIKPQNILLTESGEAKVADFGIAKTATSSTTLTRMRVIMGTLHYISPEQVQGEPASIQSDLYALGVVLYEMLTGELPFEADTPAGLIMKHITGQLQTPKEANPEVPEGISAVNMKLLAKEPNKRYRNATELVADLERVKENFTMSPAASSKVVEESKPPTAELEVEKEDVVVTPTTVNIPELKGQKLPKALSMLAEASLSLGRETKAPSKKVPKGMIIEQDPPAGTQVQVASSVNVTISLGLEQTITTEGAGYKQHDQPKRREALAAMVVGIGLIAESFISSPSTHPFEIWILRFTIWSMQLVALMGLHRLQAPSYGKLGRAGFLVAFVGVVLKLLGITAIGVGGLQSLPESLQLFIGSFKAVSDVVVPIGMVLLGVATLRARVLQMWFGVLLIAFPIMLTAFSHGLMIPWIIEQGNLEIVGRVSQIANGIGWGIFWLLFGYTLLTSSSLKQQFDQTS